MGKSFPSDYSLLNRYSREPQPRVLLITPISTRPNAGLLELEAFLPDSVTQPRIRAPRPKSVHGRDGYVKRRYKEEMILAEIHQGILDGKDKREEPPKPLRYLQKIEKPIPRPPTPTVEVRTLFSCFVGCFLDGIVLFLRDCFTWLFYDICNKTYKNLKLRLKIQITKKSQKSQNLTSPKTLNFK